MEDKQKKERGANQEGTQRKRYRHTGMDIPKDLAQATHTKYAHREAHDTYKRLYYVFNKNIIYHRF